MFTFLLAFPLATQLASSPPFTRQPDIHGDQIVFTSEGDLWLGSIQTGDAKRITSDAGNEDNPVFSPDGTQIAFQAEYDGIRGAYVMPVEGGTPRRVSPATTFRSVTGWTPDGKNVVFRKGGVPTFYEYWLAPVGNGSLKRVPLEFASHVWYGPSNEEFCFTRFNRWNSAWFHYIGGLANQIWVFQQGKFRQITNIEGTNEYPVWCNDRIYFANEKEAKWTLMSVGAAGGKSQVEAGPYDVEIRELSTDGHQVSYEKGNEVEIFNPANSTTVSPRLRFQSDLIHLRPNQVSAQQYYESSSLTPGAKRVLVEARGQIVSLPVGEGEARLWKAKSGARLQLPTMSPDGKHVVYVSDESGEQQLTLSNADGSDVKTLTKGERQIKSVYWAPDSKYVAYYDSRMSLRIVKIDSGDDVEIDRFSGTWYGTVPSFSPDSKWIAYANTILNTSTSAIFVYNVETKEKKQLGNGLADDNSPSFSKDGKWLAFFSNRNMVASNDPILNHLTMAPMGVVYFIPLQKSTPSPFLLKDPSEEEAKQTTQDVKSEDKGTKIDWDGFYERRIEVPGEGKRISQVAMTSDRILISGSGQISYFDISAKKSGVLTTGNLIDMSKDGSKLLIGQGSQIRVVDSIGSDVPPTAGSVSFGLLKLRIDPKPEWNQMFWDAWRLLRDYFYLENMHGNDWKAIGQKYSALLPRVRSRGELDELIRWMQGEIGSSHEYLSPGDTQSIKPRVVPGFLGVDLEKKGDFLQISHIVRGDGFRQEERSPLADPALNITDGMYLLKVGGVEVKSSIQVFDQLLGRVGQIVSLTVNDKAQEEGSRTVFIKPIGDESRMRYVEWVEKNRQYVEKASGGRVGYLHIEAMGNDDFADFVKQYFAQRNKEALIVDDRFNNGGYVQTFVNNILGVKVSGYFNMRNSREPWSRQGDAFLGPMCCLINEFAISCGEEFPHRFRDLGLGPIIGRRTEGGEVGSSPGWSLVDGGVVSVPNYGMFTMKDGWVIEGAGVSPDIDVASDPNAWITGRDPQLDVAVKTMLDALKKKPVVWPKEPAPRIRVKK